MTEQTTQTPGEPSKTEGMTELQRMNLESFLDSYASEVRSNSGADWERRFITGWFNGQMRAKNDEVKRLKAQLESIRAAHDEAQSVLSVLNADPTVAMFQIATHFQTMGNKVGRILQDEQP